MHLGTGNYTHKPLPHKFRPRDPREELKGLPFVPKAAPREEERRLVDIVYKQGGGGRDRDRQLQSQSGTKQITLNDQERKVYGNRCPEGYEKLRLLGKGGCALVWLGRVKHTEQLVAMKQFPKTGEQKSANDLETSKTERLVNHALFNEDGTPRGELAGHPGI